MKLKKTIVICSLEQYGGDFPGYDSTLADTIEWFQKKLELVPPEYRSEATCQISSETSYGSSQATIEIAYYRMETNEEETQRERDQETRRSQEEQRLLAQLERVRATRTS